MVHGSMQNDQDAALVVAREELLESEWDSKAVEKHLEDLPFQFASSLGALLQSIEGKELLGTSMSGLRGHLMHGSGGPLIPVLSAIPCFVDCVDAVSRPLLSVCCKREIMRIKPALHGPGW